MEAPPAEQGAAGAAGAPKAAGAAAAAASEMIPAADPPRPLAVPVGSLPTPATSGPIPPGLRMLSEAGARPAPRSRRHPPSAPRAELYPGSDAVCVCFRVCARGRARARVRACGRAWVKSRSCEHAERR